MADMPRLAAMLHAAADETDDMHDHDELHAAGALVQAASGQPYDAAYIGRWVAALMKEHLDG